MPRAPRLCSYPDCLERAASKGRCERHPFEDLDGPWVRAPGREYGSRLPAAVRRAVARRDDYTCQICGRPALLGGMEIDHFVPRAEGGTDDMGNLRVLCSACNRRKAAREAARGRERSKNAGM
jgi:5-methylcytosine-specific restriction endonuclease McrA